MSHSRTRRTCQAKQSDHALVFWPGEDCVNAVPLAKITTPCPAARGDTCTVVFSKQTHTGVVVEIGSKRQMYELEDNFLDGSYDIPFQTTNQKAKKTVNEESTQAVKEVQGREKAAKVVTKLQRRRPLLDVSNSSQQKRSRGIQQAILDLAHFGDCIDVEMAPTRTPPDTSTATPHHTLPTTPPDTSPTTLHHT